MCVRLPTSSRDLGLMEVAALVLPAPLSLSPWSGGGGGAVVVVVVGGGGVGVSEGRRGSSGIITMEEEY